MKTLFILSVTFLALPQYSMASQSVEACQAKVDFMHLSEMRDLERSKFAANSDKFIIQTRIQRLEMQIAIEKAACGEEQGYAKPDDEYRHPRRMDDDTSEVDFNNSQNA